MSDNYTARLSDIIVKAHTGGQLTPEERQMLQEALKSVAPSSHEFKGISDALAATGSSATYVPGNGDLRSQIAAQSSPASLPAAPTPGAAQPAQPAGASFDESFLGVGPPTLDWVQGIRDFASPQNPPDWNQSYDAPRAGNLTDSGPDLSWEQDGDNTDPDRHNEASSVVPPGASTKNINYEAMNGGIPGPQLAAGHGLEAPMGKDDVADVSAVTFPQGYSFSNSNETAIDMFKYNPDLFNRNLTENVLDQPGMEEYWNNKTRAAMNMSAYGLLGGGNGRSDLGGGPTTSAGSLAATEDFMKQFAQPGVQTVDPGEVYSQIFQRAENTDWSKEMSRQNPGQQMGPEEQIQITNEALLTSMGFSNPETEAWVTSLLENAKQEYMMYLAQGGDSSVSYPKFLDETMGFSDLLRT